MPPNSRTSANTKAERKAKAKAAAAAARQVERRRALHIRLAAGVLAALILAGLFAIYQSAGGPPGAAGSSGQYVYQVGAPGPGEQSIDFTLPTTTTGGAVSLAGLRGQTVLLYFHEGLGCQPCWDQIRDLEARTADLKAAGIDQFYSITSGPADLIAQKMRDDNLSSTALADTDLAVSKQYQMNRYGMMGDSRDGHSFLLVGPDGKITWRADYGGEPNFTMYVPVDQLLADLRAGTSR